MRISKYVAQDNLEPVSCRILHRSLDAYFSGYSAAQGRYVPTRRLQYEYPDEAYTAASDDCAPVGDDSNLLAHDEVQVGPAGAALRRVQPGRSGLTLAKADL